MTKLRVHLWSVFVLIVCCFCATNEGGWTAQCWKKHNSGSIQTPDGEFKRPFGILCTYQCLLWFPPILKMGICERTSGANCKFYFIVECSISRHDRRELPSFPYCEFVFDLRMSRHFTSFPDCYEIRCNETFSFLGSQ